MFFNQVQGRGDNFSYVIGDEHLRKAAVVDVSFNSAEIIRILNQNKFVLEFIISTHGHSDHTAENTHLKTTMGGKIVDHNLASFEADTKVADGQILKVGEIELKVIHTPGHTPDSICLLANNERLLTGDTLFVGECGRTDLPGGNPRSMYHSLFEKLLKLDDDIKVYPGHNYGVKPFSTIGEEKRSNYVLRPRSIEEFVEFMSEP